MYVRTGPWMVKEWKSGDYIEYQKNPTYREPGKPYLDKMIVKADSFPNGTIEYNPVSGPNSNSFARYVGESAGTGLLPRGILLWGWRTRLPGLE